MKTGTHLYSQNVIACIWDFDKTLVPNYMQAPLFKHYGILEEQFWIETNALVDEYHRRGYRLSGEIGYLNHILTYVISGKMSGLNNSTLKKLGSEIIFYPGLPEFFGNSKNWVKEKPEYIKHDIQLEHYIISTGLAQMIAGSKIAPYVDGIWGCEFIENPLEPGFLGQSELSISAEAEIAQIGMVIDNTTKTRALFEINKGTNKNSSIDVNSNIKTEDRRIPFENMIYIADGPSDVPSFSVVKKNGGRTYGVFNPQRPDEFEQNDRLRQAGRIDYYGPADYKLESNTTNWLKLQVQQICNIIVNKRENALKEKTTRPPRHLNLESQDNQIALSTKKLVQDTFID
jgi:hypothetical protein